MATIGVTRGLGDHNLKVCSSTLPIKPFLSCFPEVSPTGAPNHTFPPLGVSGWLSPQVPLSPWSLSILLPIRCECMT